MYNSHHQDFIARFSYFIIPKPKETQTDLSFFAFTPTYMYKDSNKTVLKVHAMSDKKRVHSMKIKIITTISKKREHIYQSLKIQESGQMH